MDELDREMLRQERGPMQSKVPEESRYDISAHGFWKQGTTVIFDIKIINSDTGSYLHMTPQKIT